MARRARALLLPSFALLLLPVLRADEGVWLPNQFPSVTVQQKYGFRPSPQFLKHLQLAAVRFNNGGTGSFVSPDGLLFTNHHAKKVYGADILLKELGF